MLGRARRAWFAWRVSPHRRIRTAGRLVEWRRRRQFHAFGPGSVVHRPRFVQGAHRISVGAGVYVLHDAWLSAEPDAWRAPEPALVLGDRVAIRTDVTISAAASVVIEHDVVLGGGVTVIDSDHTHDGPAEAVVGNPLVAEPIRIGAGSWLGDRVTVLKGATIGRACIIGAGSVVRGDIPDRSIAVGAPARVVGRTGEQAAGDGS